MVTIDIGAAVIGAVGIGIAIVANGRAKKANKHAQVANDVAAKALREAREANRIAEEANQLSEDANAVARGQAAREVERWHVDWSVEWDAETDALTLVNTGSHAANDLSVVIKGDQFHHIADRQGNLSAGEDLSLTLAEIGDKRRDHVEQQQRITAELRGTRVVRVPRHYGIEVNVLITWSTGLGRPETKTLDLVLR